MLQKALLQPLLMLQENSLGTAVNVASGTVKTARGVSSSTFKALTSSRMVAIVCMFIVLGLVVVLLHFLQKNTLENYVNAKRSKNRTKPKEAKKERKKRENHLLKEVEEQQEQEEHQEQEEQRQEQQEEQQEQQEEHH